MFKSHLFSRALALPFVVLVALAAPTAGYGAVMFTLGTPAEVPNAASIEIANTFQVVNTLTATAVGAYIPVDDRAAGLSTANYTGSLYSLSGNGDPSIAGNYTLIEKITIPLGTAIDSDNFAYVNFATSHVLTAGQRYVVGSWRGISSLAIPEASKYSEKGTGAPVTDSNVTWVNSQYRYQTTGYPTSIISTTINDFGGNLQFTVSEVPEPASIGLMATAGLMLIRRKRA